jgi:hypothetical protein
MPEHAYNDTTNDIAKSWCRVHANGEQTHVYLLSCDDSDYTAVAVDVDPREYDAVAAEVIEYTSALEAACASAQAWMAQHPKGIVGAGDGDDGDGLASKVWRGLQKLDQSATPQEEDTA